MIANAAIPRSLSDAIGERYQQLVTPDNCYVAVRSSVAVRDTGISSFPGMMDTYHYVRGVDEVIAKVLQCWASLWSSRAAYLRHHKGISHDQGIIAPVVQLMVSPETAGVLFTANPVTKDRGEVIIEVQLGIGRIGVSGRSMNDYFILDKSSLEVRKKKIANKTLMVVMDGGRGSGRIGGAGAERRFNFVHNFVRCSTCRTRRGRQDGRGPLRIQRRYRIGHQGPQLFILQARKIRELTN